MANIIKLKNISHLYTMGDIHGEFAHFLRTVLQHCKKNSCIFVCGDCGFGFNKLAYYEQELKKYNDMLAQANRVVVFVRGNHDDPSYFFQQKLSFSNILLVPDYTIVKAQKKNILCIGGGISIDRLWRKQEESKLNKHKTHEDNFKRLYWADEEPIFNDTLLDEIKELGINVDIVISHAAPKENFPKAFIGGNSWFRVDKNLRKDIDTERETMSKIYEKLIANGNNIKMWHYGHYHAYHKEIIGDTEFVCNDCDMKLQCLDKPINLNMVSTFPSYTTSATIQFNPFEVL